MPNSRETIRFSASVGAGDTEELTKTMRAEGTVEEVRVRFYRGPELAVEVRPFARKGEPGAVEEEPLVETVGDDVIVGDADDFLFATTESFEPEDEIGVTVEHTGASYSYDVNVDLTVDYEGGTSRSITSFLGGWF